LCNRRPAGPEQNRNEHQRQENLQKFFGDTKENLEKELADPEDLTIFCCFKK
jgi:hypothetical protein